MVAIKEAVKTAEQTLEELLENSSAVQLEEILISEDEKYWLVTLSYLSPHAEAEFAPKSLLQEEIRAIRDGKQSPRLLRKYKTFEIDRSTGDFHQMKIRVLPGA